MFKIPDLFPDFFLYRVFSKRGKIYSSIYYSKLSRSLSCHTLDHDLYHTTKTIYDCAYDVVFLKCSVSFRTIVTARTPSKKFSPFFSDQLIEYLPKVSGIIEMSFWKCEMGFYVVSDQQRLAFEPSELFSLLFPGFPKAIKMAS